MLLATDNQTVIADKFDLAVQETIRTMVNGDIELLGKQATSKTNSWSNSIDSGMTVVGLAGDLQGTISISLTKSAALEWTRALIQHETEEVDQTVVDAVGELGNIVVGTAKRNLTDFQLSISLPSVIRGGRNAIVFPSSSKPIQLNYSFADSVITVVIALSAT
jgi:CheY-specific phosphatase CheX